MVLRVGRKGEEQFSLLKWTLAFVYVLNKHDINPIYSAGNLNHDINDTLSTHNSYHEYTAPQKRNR